MKKLTAKIVTVTMAMTVAGSSLPVYGNLATNKGTKQQVEQKLKGKNYAEHEAIVMFQKNAKSTSSTTKSIEEQNLKIVRTYDFDDIRVENKGINAKSTQTNTSVTVALVKSDADTTEEIIKKLKDSKDVLYAEPNYKIHKMDMDPYKDYQWGLDNFGQNKGTPELDVNADAVTETSEGEKVIAVVDTGIDYNHEDLQEVLWNNPYSQRKLAGKHGYDFINSDGDPLDDNGHGSHVSGIMKANAGNGKGIQGVNQSSNVKIMALKILDEDGYGFDMEAVGAYNYIYKAQQLGTNVVAINNSWGGADGEETNILKELINLTGEKGALTICAAGNDGKDNDEFPDYPWCAESDYIVSVAATNEKDEIAAFSNYGKESVDLAAPGADILSTVCYDCFNPVLYGKDSPLISKYEDFDGETYNLSPQIRLKGLNGESGDAEVKVEVSNQENFGKEDGKSLQWTIKGAKEGESYYLDIPYSAPGSSTDVYAGFSLKASGPVGELHEDWFGNMTNTVSDLYITDGIYDGQVDEEKEGNFGYTGVDQGNYWRTLYSSIECPKNKETDRAFSFCLDVYVDGDYTINIDNFAVSGANAKSEDFGKYDFYNGTSMATPFVAAAVANLADAYPDESVLERKARLLGSTRKVDNLKNQVTTSGVLDLSHASNPYMFVDKIKYNRETKKIEIKGNFLENSQIYINNELVEGVVSSEEKTASVDGADFENKTIQIKVSKEGYDYETSFFVSAGKSFDIVENYLEFSMLGGELISDGNSLFYVDYKGRVQKAQYEDTKGKDEKPVRKLVFTDSTTEEIDIDMFGDEYKNVADYAINKASFISVANGIMYQIVDVDLGYSQSRFLISYDLEKGWKVECDLPDELIDYDGMILGIFNGKLYLMGGLNVSDGTVSNQIYAYDAKEKKFEKAGEMPQNRAFGKALQVGKNLVVTLGNDGTSEAPKNLIFNGKDWTVSNATLGEVKEPYKYEYGIDDKEKKTLSIFTAQTGLVDDGIIYTDLQVEGLGDTFIYSVSKDAFTASEYALGNTDIKGDELVATTWKDRLYVVSGLEYMEDDDDEEESVENKKTANYEYSEEEDYLPSYEESLGYVYSIPVKNGMISVVDDSELPLVYLEGVGGYLPGDQIVLTVKVMQGMEESIKIKGFTVNGKAVKADSKGVYTYTVDSQKQGQVIKTHIDYDMDDHEGGNEEPYNDYKEQIPHVGMKASAGSFTYKVTKFSAKKKEVTLLSYKNKKKGKNAIIPKTVKIKGF
ncbi:MAG: S8 family serine peptidase, partial [Eubacterium sp.]|nr:S8 family serine peptidase [Eubacterium sp.]